MSGVIDFFSGVGGLSLGAARGGFSVLAAIEHDEIALNTHTVNFPRTDHRNWDINQIDAKHIERELKDAVAGVATSV